MLIKTSPCSHLSANRTREKVCRDDTLLQGNADKRDRRVNSLRDLLLGVCLLVTPLCGGRGVAEGCFA